MSPRAGSYPPPPPPSDDVRPSAFRVGNEARPPPPVEYGKGEQYSPHLYDPSQPLPPPPPAGYPTGKGEQYSPHPYDPSQPPPPPPPAGYPGQPAWNQANTGGPYDAPQPVPYGSSPQPERKDDKNSMWKSIALIFGACFCLDVLF